MLDTYVGYGQSFSMCRANRVSHLHNRRCGIWQIVRLQRDTLIGDFLLCFVWHFSLFIESVRRSDVYRRQLRGICGLYFLHQRFTTVKRRMSEYLILPLAKRRDQLPISKSLHAHDVTLTARRGRYLLVSQWPDAKIAPHRSARERIRGHDFRAAAKSIASEVARVCVRHTVPAARVAGPVASSGRLTHYLGAPLRRDRATAGRTRCWQRGGRKSGRLHHRVSSRHSRDRCPLELSLRPYLQRRHDRLGNFSALAVAEGHRLPVVGEVKLPA